MIDHSKNAIFKDKHILFYDHVHIFHFLLRKKAKNLDFWDILLCFYKNDFLEYQFKVKTARYNI